MTVYIYNMYVYKKLYIASYINEYVCIYSIYKYVQAGGTQLGS